MSDCRCGSAECCAPLGRDRSRNIARTSAARLVREGGRGWDAGHATHRNLQPPANSANAPAGGDVATDRCRCGLFGNPCAHPSSSRPTPIPPRRTASSTAYLEHNRDWFLAEWVFENKAQTRLMENEG